MLKKAFQAIIDKDNQWLTLLVFGSALALAAFIDEIPKTGVKIRDSAYQPLLLVLGAIVVLSAIGLVIYHAIQPPVTVVPNIGPDKGRPKLNVKAIGLQVSTPVPREGEILVCPFKVAGTVAKMPPAGWELHLIVISSRDKRPTYWPYNEVKIKDKRTWSIDYTANFGTKELQLYLVGKDGQALIRAFFDINREHLTKNPGSHSPLFELTSDMLKACEPVHVTIAPPQPVKA